LILAGLVQVLDCCERVLHVTQGCDDRCTVRREQLEILGLHFIALSLQSPVIEDRLNQVGAQSERGPYTADGQDGSRQHGVCHSRTTSQTQAWKQSGTRGDEIRMAGAQV